MMKEIEFNLLDEKWILARKSDCTVDELSLTDALLKAHEYVELAGELPTQDVAVLRLMLAVCTLFFKILTGRRGVAARRAGGCGGTLEGALDRRSAARKADKGLP